MRFPQVEYILPEYMPFIARLVLAVQSGQIDSVPKMADQVRAFFTPAMMDKMEAVLPGWKAMSAYADGQTLTHVTTVMVAMLFCPEFRRALPRQQALMKWVVLLHDIAKQAEPGKRDPIHAFRSAALASKALVRLGFPIRGGYEAAIAAWAAFTRDAILLGQSSAEPIQDNRKLPAIVEGIDRLFGPGSSASLILKTILFHMSVNVVSDWPQAAPLTDAEILRYIDSRLLPLLKIMMLIDNDAWSFFDPPIKQRQRQETRAVFTRLERALLTP